MTEHPNKNMGKSVSQLLRFGLVGVLSNSALYFFYLLMTYFGLEPKIAMTISYLVGVFMGFVGHQYWSFSYGGDARRAAVRYFTAHIAGYMLNLSILAVFVDWLDWAHQQVQAVAIIAVAVFLFVSFKYFVFQDGPKVSGEA